MNYIIFDLELTCWEGDMAGRQQEIIEIGAIKINSYGHSVSQFTKFVKPVHFPILSPYCINLTSISQSQINHAKHFKEIFPQFIDWCEHQGDPYYLIAWGHSDQKFLLNECKSNKLDTDWSDFYIDLNKMYTKIKKLRENVSLTSALNMEMIEWEGQQHRAEDDAYNLSKLFVRYFADWDLHKDLI